MEEVEGFSRAEYLFTFQSIIIGFVASSYFEGLGSIFKNRQKYYKSSLFLFFTILSFLLLIIFWWQSWFRSVEITRSISEYIKLLPYSLVFYALNVVLFENISKSTHDLNQLYLRIHRKLFALLFCYFLYDLFFGYSQNLLDYRLLGLLLTVLGMLSKNLKIHAFILGSGLLAIFYLIYSDFQISPDVKNPKDINYSKAEHLAVFTSFLYGYILSKFFTGWSNIIRKSNHSKFSLIYILWTLFTFLLIVDVWWGSWLLKLYISDYLFNFLIILLSPFLLYLVAEYFFPDSNSYTQDYWTFFSQQKNKVFFIFFLQMIVRVILSIYFDLVYHEFFQNVLRILGAILAVLVIKTNSKKGQYILFLSASALVALDLLWKIQFDEF